MGDAKRKGSGPEIPDGWELNKDGTIALTIDNERWRLRRPKLGEFRTLRDAVRDRDDERVRILAKYPALDPLDKDKASDEDKRDRALEIAERSRAMNDAIEALNVEWVLLVLVTLGDGDPPEADDLPSGTEEAEFVMALMNHWRSVPLRSGGG